MRFATASFPIVTILGLQFGVVLTGAVITETIFAWPGIGRLLIQSISFRDYPTVQGCVLLIAVTYVGVNLDHGPHLRISRSAYPGRSIVIRLGAAIVLLTVVGALVGAMGRARTIRRARSLRCGSSARASSTRSVSTSLAATFFRACSRAPASRCSSG